MDSYKELGCVPTYLPVNEDGVLTTQILEKYFTKKGAILALSYANPLTGVIQPMEEIHHFCKKNGILVYLQGSEMFAKLFSRLEDLDVDFFSFSADLFHGPKGVGGVFYKGKRKNFELSSISNLPGLIGMGIAAGEVLDFMEGMTLETAYLRSYFEEALSKLIGDVVFFGNRVKRLPNTTCFAIPSIHAEYLTYCLCQKDMFVTYGGGRCQKLEYQLLECGVPLELAKCAISCALSKESTEKEMKDGVNIIFEVMQECLKVRL